jgi:hypothetical protein
MRGWWCEKEPQDEMSAMATRQSTVDIVLQSKIRNADPPTIEGLRNSVIVEILLGCRTAQLKRM